MPRSHKADAWECGKGDLTINPCFQQYVNGHTVSCIQRITHGEQEHVGWRGIKRLRWALDCIVLQSRASASRGGNRNADEAVSDGQRPNWVDHCFDRGDVDQRRRNVEPLHIGKFTCEPVGYMQVFLFVGTSTSPVPLSGWCLMPK